MDYAKVTMADGMQVVGWIKGGFPLNHVDHIVVSTDSATHLTSGDINIDTREIVDIEIITGKSVKAGGATVGDYLVQLPMVRE